MVRGLPSDKAFHMRAAAQLFVVIFSLLLLGAHFLRGGHLLVVVVILGMMVLLAVRRPWTAWTVQTVLALGALEWVRTLVGIAGVRAQAGEPVLRLVIILGAVVTLTILAALTFQSRSLRRVYRFDPRVREL